MNSEKRSDIYSEFESEANEIMFGQTTLPDRPLTAKELSKRKKTILKLLDQKLKFELIELMAQKKKQMNNVSPLTTMNHENNIDSNEGASATASSPVPTNFEYTQNFNQLHPSPEYLQPNWQPPYENVWQPPIYPQHNEINANTWYHQANNFQPNVQSLHFNQNGNMKPSFNRIQPNNNFVRPSTATSVNRQQKGITTVSKPKPSNETTSFVSVNQLTSLRKIPSSQEVNQSKDLLEPPSASLPQSKDSSQRPRRRKRRRYLEDSQQDTSNKVLENISLHNEIQTIIKPFLCPGENEHELVNKLMKTPYALEDNEMIRNRIAGNNQSVNDVMRQIKVVLDSHITARPPKKFHRPGTAIVDVPFVVNLHNKSGKMTEEYAIELQGILLDSINCLKIFPKPMLRDITFNDGSLIITCINRMSFEWLEKTISDHLSVNILPFKNVISKSGLKTICLKFEVPQYFHFNNLMEQLKENNARLLTGRWELRSSQHTNVDSTKCIYVGVDVDSLIVMEQMKRLGNLRGSSVFFEISYDNNAENFERMNFVENTSTKRVRVPISFL